MTGSTDAVRVTIYNEYVHELVNEDVAALYPNGIHRAIADGIGRFGAFDFRYATLNQPEHGLTEEVLANTDVLLWWGHKKHGAVDDAIVERVHRSVLAGMGLVALHSGHFSKIFKRIMGTHCSLIWRVADEKERLWNLMPSHPILAGIPPFFELEREEMYGERFDIPTPDELLMISWFQGGEVFRSLCTWQRGHGKIVYFRPGHETYPTYYDENVLRIIANSARWARARINSDGSQAPNAPALEAALKP